MSSLLDPGQIIKETFDDTNDAVRVNLVAGVASFTIDSEITDDAAFTPGTSEVLMVGATYDDTAPDSVNEGDGGAMRMSANRNLYTQIRDAAGNERGVNVTAGNALTVDGSASTQPVSAASLPLPTGASTEATLSTLNGKVTACNTGAVVLAAGTAGFGKLTANDGVDIGDVTINNASGGSAVNIQDGGNSITVDGTVAATQSGNWSSRTQDGSGNSISSTSNALHVNVQNSSLTIASNLDVVDFLDTPVMDTSSVNIPASASSPTQVVASLAAAVKKIKINDTTGAFIGIYTGAALSETLQCIVGPGEDGTIEVQMASSDRVSVRNMANATISVGSLCVQFIG